jgi:hypothetical protein
MLGQLQNHSNVMQPCLADTIAVDDVQSMHHHTLFNQYSEQRAGERGGETGKINRDRTAQE